MSTIPDSQEVSVSPLARSHSPIGSWIAGLSAVLTGAVCIYYRMFTGFYPWDDEGYLMIGLRSLLHGRRLYDDAYSQYGPFYYLAYTAIYSVLRQPISHDTQRFVGVALWLFSAILWARTAWLLTRSRVWCGFAFFLGIRLLAFFPLSAGHPEELCMALLSIVAVIACGSKPVGDRRSVAALACLVAAITLTKINLGLYVAIALGLMILRFGASTPVQRIAEIALSVAALVLPAALMSRMLGFAWVRDYCFVATVSISAAIFSTHAVEPVLLRTGRFWWTAVLSFIAFAVLVTAPFLVRGTTFKALLYMTVLQHAGSAKNWYTKAPINSAALLLHCSGPLPP